MKALEVEKLHKRFGGLTAVRDISFCVHPGEILGLIGPNGSGKSTVMKAILGVERPSGGSVKVRGIEVAGRAPHEIARLGVGMVFQHSRPLHRQTVLENIALALTPDSLFRLRPDRRTTARAREIASRVGLADKLDAKPAALPYADLRRIELARALARDPAIILVDEPFAGLTARETQAFAELILEMKRNGRAVLIVDHNVKSIAALADRAFAMSAGERIAEGTPQEVMNDETVRRVYLGGVLGVVARRPLKTGTALLEVADVSVAYERAVALENVSLNVGKGEFVAVVGLNGAGKTTLFNAISGMVPFSGDIRREGASLKGRSAAAIARGGIVQAPEGRDLFGDMSVGENLDMGALHLSALDRVARLQEMFALFPRLKERLRQRASTLSGGEQQMLTIARALMTKPDLLILDEPTLGLAPIVVEQISRALEKLSQDGDVTVLLGEQNVTFALPHADRVYVLDHGRIAWEGPPARFEQEAGAVYI